MKQLENFRGFRAFSGKKMSLIFGLVSAAYIAVIFLLAGLPGKLQLIHKFNPLSLLHIPLYGLLAFFLIRIFVPKREDPLIRSSRMALVISSVIALSVAVLDELHQLHIPGREASGWDVALDAVGIAGIALFYQSVVKYRK